MSNNFLIFIAFIALMSFSIGILVGSKIDTADLAPDTI